MQIERLYEYINNREKSFKDFIKFVDFMFENKNYVNSLKCETDRENFRYHFDRIPIYLRDMLEKLRFDTLGDIANTSNLITKVFDRVNELTEIN